MKTIKNLLIILLKFVKQWPIYLFCIIISAVLTSGIAYYPAILINKALINIVTSGVRSDLISIFISVIILTLSFHFCEFLIGKMEFWFIIFKRRQKEKVIDSYNAELFSQIASIKGDYLESSEIYELYIKCKRNSLPKIISFPETIINIAIRAWSVLLYSNMLRHVSVYLYLVAIVSAIIKNFLFLRRKKRQYRYDEVINKYYAKLNTFSGLITDKNFMEEIKVYDSLNFINSKRESLYNQMRIDVWKMACFDILHSFENFAIEKGIYYGSFVFLALKRMNNLITMGEFSSTIAAIKQLELSISKIFSATGNLIGDYSYYCDYFKFMESVPLQREGNDISDTLSIEIRDLEYSYLSNSCPTLKNINCKLAPGKKVCIVGRNGSGKSTLVKIIGGLYELYEGRIYMGQVDISSCSVSSMHDQMDMCPQNFIKYPFSLEYNITFEHSEKEKGLLKNSIVKSGVCDFISDLPEGVKTQLDAQYNMNGVDLSEGQWQRILLARIFYADKNIVIFDEPTSSLDPIIENQIFSEILKIKDRLVIIISHRMSCAKAMDQIIVLNDGQIVETGTHLELMKKEGYYFEMFTSQANQYDMDI